MRVVLASLIVSLFALLECHALSALERLNNATIINTPNVRTGDTCADPSLALTYSRAYAPGATLHALGRAWAFEESDADSAQAVFVNILPAFQAWTTQQPFTAPLFSLGTSNGQDLMYALGLDANTPPIVAGWTPGRVVAWVYNTSVCGSVPLFSLDKASESDHYFTIEPDAHTGLVASGWTDGGIIAYVLPLPF